MLSPTAATVRLFLHVLGATVWVGGQLTLAGLVPGLRALDPSAPRTVARRFNRIAWPAFALLVVTGGWNMSEVDFNDRPTDYQVTMFIKLTLVAFAGIGAFLHTQARTKRGLALWGAVGGLSSVATLFLGILLKTSAA
jgi:putative copper export protein